MAISSKRVLILGAGSAPGNNLIRSLRAGDPSLAIVGCNADRLVLTKSLADVNYALPLRDAAFAQALVRVVGAERIDVIIPNSETEVRRLSRLRRRLPCRTFLPSERVIERCNDKLELNSFLADRGFPVPRSYALNRMSDVDRVFRRFGKSDVLWCRLRTGTGSSAALPVASVDHARNWIEYWQDMRAIPPGSFMLSEYLPGRDFTVQCLFTGGTLVMAKMHERLAYHVVGSVPSGASSSAALAQILYDPAVVQVSVDAILSLDKRARGVFFVDLKVNAEGQACITEINAGRFANVPTIHDAASPSNMSAAYLRLALDEPVPPEPPFAPSDSCYVLRSLDTVPAVVHGHMLLSGIREAHPIDLSKVAMARCARRS